MQLLVLNELLAFLVACNIPIFPPPLCNFSVYVQVACEVENDKENIYDSLYSQIRAGAHTRMLSIHSKNIFQVF